MTMGAFIESVVEDAALALLESTGWRVLHGAEIAPGEPAAQRDNYGQVVREQQLPDTLLPKLISGRMRVKDPAYGGGHTMIKVSKETAQRAFAEFCTRRGEWVKDLGSQLGMYEVGERAFGETGRLDDFKEVYNGLRGWQVGRGGQLQEPGAIYESLGSLRSDLRRLRLSSLETDHWGPIWEAINGVRNVKTTKGGPSVMAISKFLHFWNPRLFVICDQEEVEHFVFGHRWLSSHLEDMDNVLRETGVETDREPRLSYYIRVLIFASGFVKQNTHILTVFAQTVRDLARDNPAVPDDIQTYEAAAAEWCLIGLAEMPPSGVEVLGGQP